MIPLSPLAPLADSLVHNHSLGLRVLPLIQSPGKEVRRCQHWGKGVIVGNKGIIVWPPQPGSPPPWCSPAPRRELLLWWFLGKSRSYSTCSSSPLPLCKTPGRSTRRRSPPEKILAFYFGKHFLLTKKWPGQDQASALFAPVCILHRLGLQVAPVNISWVIKKHQQSFIRGAPRWVCRWSSSLCCWRQGDTLAGGRCQPALAPCTQCGASPPGVQVKEIGGFQNNLTSCATSLTPSSTQS